MKTLLSATAVTLVLMLANTASAHSMPPADMDETPSYMQETLAKLPPQQAMHMRESLSEAQSENKEIYEQIRQVRKDMYRILTAPKFNQEAYLDKSNKLRQLHDQADANLSESFTTAMAPLSMAQRKMIAQSMYDDHMHHEHHMMKHMSNRDNPGTEEPGSQYPSPPNAPVRP